MLVMSVVLREERGSWSRIERSGRLFVSTRCLTIPLESPDDFRAMLLHSNPPIRESAIRSTSPVVRTSLHQSDTSRSLAEAQGCCTRTGSSVKCSRQHAECLSEGAWCVVVFLCSFASLNSRLLSASADLGPCSTRHPIRQAVSDAQDTRQTLTCLSYSLFSLSIASYSGSP